MKIARAKPPAAPGSVSILVIPRAGDPTELATALLTTAERIAHRLIVPSAETHVCTALGLAACRQGRRVRFVTVADLVIELAESQAEHSLPRLEQQLAVSAGTFSYGIRRGFADELPNAGNTAAVQV